MVFAGSVDNRTVTTATCGKSRGCVLTVTGQSLLRVVRIVRLGLSRLQCYTLFVCQCLCRCVDSMYQKRNSNKRFLLVATWSLSDWTRLSDCFRLPHHDRILSDLRDNRPPCVVSDMTRASWSVMSIRVGAAAVLGSGVLLDVPTA